MNSHLANAAIQPDGILLVFQLFQRQAMHLLLPILARDLGSDHAELLLRGDGLRLDLLQDLEKGRRMQTGGAG